MKAYFLYLPIILSYLLYKLYLILQGLGIFHSTYTKYPENHTCKLHEKTLFGSEDITKISQNLAVISQDNRLFGLKPNKPNGSLSLLNLDSEEITTLPIKNYPENGNFYPHGIYYLENKQYLYIINHPFNNKTDQIDVVKVDFQNEVQLTYLKSLILPEELNNIGNDLLTVDENNIYITQTFTYPQPTNIEEAQKSSSQIKNDLTLLLDKASTYVYHCQSLPTNNILNCTKLEQTLDVLNNGINWNNKDTVLVSNYKQRRAAIYNYDGNTDNKLSIQQHVPLTGHPDNIEYEKSEDCFYATGIMRIVETMDSKQKAENNLEEFIKNERNSWSFVDQICRDPISKEYTKVKNILSNKETIAGCSVAIPYKDKIILGSWFDRTISICHLK